MEVIRMSQSLADELRGEPRNKVNTRMVRLLPEDVRAQFLADVEQATEYLPYIDVVEAYAQRFKLGFGPGDLTVLHDEEPEWSSLIRHAPNIEPGQ